jgi:hypothetical protein
MQNLNTNVFIKSSPALMLMGNPVSIRATTPEGGGSKVTSDLQGNTVSIIDNEIKYFRGVKIKSEFIHPVYTLTIDIASKSVAGV